MNTKTTPKDLQHLSDSELFSELDRENETGFQTEDLVKIYRAKDGPWLTHETSEQFMLYVGKILDGPSQPDDAGHTPKKRYKRKS